MSMHARATHWLGTAALVISLAACGQTAPSTPTPTLPPPPPPSPPSSTTSRCPGPSSTHFLRISPSARSADSRAIVGKNVNLARRRHRQRRPIWNPECRRGRRKSRLRRRTGLTTERRVRRAATGPPATQVSMFTWCRPRCCPHRARRRQSRRPFSIGGTVLERVSDGTLPVAGATVDLAGDDSDRWDTPRR